MSPARAETLAARVCERPQPRLWSRGFAKSLQRETPRPLGWSRPWTSDVWGRSPGLRVCAQRFRPSQGDWLAPTPQWRRGVEAWLAAYSCGYSAGLRVIWPPHRLPSSPQHHAAEPQTECLSTIVGVSSEQPRGAPVLRCGGDLTVATTKMGLLGAVLMRQPGVAAFCDPDFWGSRR